MGEVIHIGLCGIFLMIFMFIKAWIMENKGIMLSKDSPLFKEQPSGVGRNKFEQTRLSYPLRSHPYWSGSVWIGEEHR
ncbi:MAG: hypothetical protein KAV99_03500 [Candidatus Latescibacteria bacterium]|nr:hypothetical protein [Candidatus Latescibacterota bacterium]